MAGAALTVVRGNCRTVERRLSPAVSERKARVTRKHDGPVTSVLRGRVPALKEATGVGCQGSKKRGLA